jgi:hypothetical protein
VSQTEQDRVGGGEANAVDDDVSGLRFQGSAHREPRFDWAGLSLTDGRAKPDPDTLTLSLPHPDRVI